MNMRQRCQQAPPNTAAMASLNSCGMHPNDQFHTVLVRRSKPTIPLLRNNSRMPIVSFHRRRRFSFFGFSKDDAVGLHILVHLLLHHDKGH